jgi:hypothetical protein
MTTINDAVRTVADYLNGRTPTVTTITQAIMAAARHHYSPVNEIVAALRIQEHITQHIEDVTQYAETTGVVGERIPALHSWIRAYQPSPAEMTREIYAAAAKVYGDIYGC